MLDHQSLLSLSPIVHSNGFHSDDVAAFDEVASVIQIDIEFDSQSRHCHLPAGCNLCGEEKPKSELLIDHFRKDRKTTTIHYIDDN